MGPINSLYSSLIAGSKLQSDLLQTTVISQLDKFLEDSINKNSFWNRFFLKEGEKGVYLHGSVGSGKTMLMDLFHMAASPVLKCKRLHYNEFMLDVHSSKNNFIDRSA